MKDRHYSLLIPWFTSGAIALVQTAVPLLALRYGASAIVLGAIGWVPQVIRLPVCFVSGRLSDRIGRMQIVVPAACAIAAAAAGLGLAKSNAQIMILYSLVVVAMGAFFPPLQALIGDISKRGELRKNITHFNVAASMGGTVAAFAAARLIHASIALAFYAAAGSALLSACLSIAWRSKPAENHDPPDALVRDHAGAGHLLIISRMTHFTGYFAFGSIRMLFPKLGQSLGWSEGEVAASVALLVAGEAAGVVATSLSGWWRGKLWLQVALQITMLVCATAIALASSVTVFRAAFFAAGAASGIAYAAALYQGLSGRKAHGKNAGIHESLVAGGYISGCLLGGLAAQLISVRAPYSLLAGIAVACLAGTAVLSISMLKKKG